MTTDQSLLRFVNETKHVHPAVQQWLVNNGYINIQHEVRLGHGARLDFIAEKDDRKLIVEVKIDLSSQCLKTAVQVLTYRRHYRPSSKVAVAGVEGTLDDESRSIYRKHGIQVIEVEIDLHAIGDERQWDQLREIRYIAQCHGITFELLKIAGNDVKAEQVQNAIAKEFVAHLLRWAAQRGLTRNEFTTLVYSDLRAAIQFSPKKAQKYTTSIAGLLGHIHGNSQIPLDIEPIVREWRGEAASTYSWKAWVHSFDEKYPGVIDHEKLRRLVPDLDLDTPSVPPEQKQLTAGGE